MLYPIDKTKVDELLQYIDELQPTVMKMAEVDSALLEQDSVHRLAAERLILLLTEAFTDVFALIIDGLMLRDPGSYQDMVEIMTLEGALPKEYGEKLEELVAFRGRLVRDYVHVSAAELIATLRLLGQIFPPFTGYIRAFLDHELF